MSKGTPENKASGAKNKKPLPELKPMSAADIKAQINKSKEGTLIELPVSKMIFRVGKKSISNMLRDDLFPNELVASAIQMDTQNLKVESREDYLRSVDVMDSVVIYSSITPKVVKTEAEVDDDSIWIRDLDDYDRFAIYNFAQTGVEPLRKFRNGDDSEDDGPSLPKVPEPKA